MIPHLRQHRVPTSLTSESISQFEGSSMENLILCSKRWNDVGLWQIRVKVDDLRKSTSSFLNRNRQILHQFGSSVFSNSTSSFSRSAVLSANMTMNPPEMSHIRLKWNPASIGLSRLYYKWNQRRLQIMRLLSLAALLGQVTLWLWPGHYASTSSFSGLSSLERMCVVYLPCGHLSRVLSFHLPQPPLCTPW